MDVQIKEGDRGGHFESHQPQIIGIVRLVIFYVVFFEKSFLITPDKMLTKI